MRVVKKAYLPSVIALSEVVDLDDMIGIFSPEAREEPGAIVEADTFKLLKPGHERAIILFRVDGLTYGEIGEVLGLSEGQVRTVIYTIRTRLVKTLGKRRILK